MLIISFLYIWVYIKYTHTHTQSTLVIGSRLFHFMDNKTEAWNQAAS